VGAACWEGGVVLFLLERERDEISCAGFFAYFPVSFEGFLQREYSMLVCGDVDWLLKGLWWVL
jgi:hypothetical protein